MAQVAGESPEAQHAAGSECCNAQRRRPGDEVGALRAMLTGGLSALSAEQRSACWRANPDIRAAMSTTTGSEGGYTVARV
jgi:hypothetical protein